MRSQDIASLFDFNYWANDALLKTIRAASLSDAQLAAPGTFTYRGLRATLVLILDVESSWRKRLQGLPAAIWDTSLDEGDFPSIEPLEVSWRADEAEMRTWLATLTDSDLAAATDLGDGDSFPLWYYLVHIVTHSEQQRRDVQLLLRDAGVEPPDLEFLYYADHLASLNSTR